MITALKKILKKTNYRCARKGKKYFLTRLSGPGMIFLSPEDFVEGLHKQGLTISPKTLVISKLKEKTGSTTQKKDTKHKKPAAKPDLSKLPYPEIVRKMKYNDLKSLAADYNLDIPGRIKKVDLLKLVIDKLYS